MFATAMRTHACGELRATDAGTEVALCGWVARRRDHGGVTFIDLRDREGAVQVVFHPEEAAEAHATAQDLRSEWVVRVTGTVRERPEGMVNPALETGEVEVATTGLEIVSRAETPPFLIEDRVEAEEHLREFLGDLGTQFNGAGRGHGELDAVQAARRKGAGAIEEAVRAVGTDERDDFLGFDAVEDFGFGHGERRMRAEVESEEVRVERKTTARGKTRKRLRTRRG